MVVHHQSLTNALRAPQKKSKSSQQCQLVLVLSGALASGSGQVCRQNGSFFITWLPITTLLPVQSLYCCLHALLTDTLFLLLVSIYRVRIEDWITTWRGAGIPLSSSDRVLSTLGNTELLVSQWKKHYISVCVLLNVDIADMPVQIKEVTQFSPFLIFCISFLPSYPCSCVFKQSFPLLKLWPSACDS